MALTIDSNVPVFDLSAIKRSDAIRVRRATGNDFRNGIVSRLDKNQVQVLVVNPQSNANSFLIMDAGDVAIGLWEVWWTMDFLTVNYQPSAGSNSGGGGA